MATHRRSFLARLWVAGLVTGGGLSVYLLVGWCLGKLDKFLDPLNALAGVFVAFFTLVLLLIERERDNREEANAEQHKERTDQQISAVAFLVSRQLASWLREIDATESVDDLEGTLAVLGEIDDDVYERILFPLMDWWAGKARDQDEAERRFEHELVPILPEASASVANAVRHSFVKFCDFAGRWNHQAVVRKQGDKPEWKEIVTGLKSLQSATAGLEAAIDPQLRTIRDEVTPLSSPIHDLAEALMREFEKTDRPEAPPRRYG